MTETTTTPPPSVGATGGADAQLAAAVDLGSNSFHMVVGKVDLGQVVVLDRERERVALATGLDETKDISGEAMSRALDCLARFGQRLRDNRVQTVRAVGTNTLRRARNARAFLRKAEKALGYPIDIISGVEEARLVYLGVAHSIPDVKGRRLVVDIGGGSTEVILGEHFEAQKRDSFYMGCVTWTERFFGDGSITQKRFERAELAARLETESVVQSYRDTGWVHAIGSSGTITAVAEAVRANGWTDEDGVVTTKSLRKLRKLLLTAGHIDKLSAVTGIKETRWPVIAGGLAILEGVFSSFGIDRMRVSKGALREGLLYDLAGRIQREDVRDRTIRRTCERFGVDVAHAEFVEQTALAMLDQVAASWDVPVGLARRFLGWSARLHAVGMSVAYSGYHKHGAYLVANADMPGFSRDDQLLLAALVLNHRRRFDPSRFVELREEHAKVGPKLSILLRLSVRLYRSHAHEVAPAFALAAAGQNLSMSLPEGWLDKHPLTRLDFEREAEYLAAVGYTFTFR